MKVLAIGDVVGNSGCEFLRKKLPEIKQKYNIDLVIANGENSAEGNGITPSSADFLLNSGVDVITTGNHCFRRREMYKKYDDCFNIIRPANFPTSFSPGTGVCVLDMLKYQVVIINIMGTVFMEPIDSPFKVIDKILKSQPKDSIIIVDFHAEATSEKRAMGFYLNGRVSAIFGTHTHIPTADACILRGGTGYITDVGMTGVIESNLGVKPEIIIKKLTTKMPVRFEYASGECKMDIVILDIDEKSRKTTDIKRLTVI